jgi:hypothetical protein
VPLEQQKLAWDMEKTGLQGTAEHQQAQARNAFDERMKRMDVQAGRSKAQQEAAAARDTELRGTFANWGKRAEGLGASAASALPEHAQMWASEHGGALLRAFPELPVSVVSGALGSYAQQLLSPAAALAQAKTAKGFAPDDADADGNPAVQAEAARLVQASRAAADQAADQIARAWAQGASRG